MSADTGTSPLSGASRTSPTTTPEPSTTGS